MLMGLAATVYFGSTLSLVRTLIVALVNAGASAVTTTLYYKTIGSKKTPLKIVGAILYFLINAVVVYIIMVMVATTSTEE
jgi:uncharacterized membrane protein